VGFQSYFFFTSNPLAAHGIEKPTRQEPMAWRFLSPQVLGVEVRVSPRVKKTLSILIFLARLNKKLLSIPYLNLCKIVFYIIEMRF
jgi:hypothetical protein